LVNLLATLAELTVLPTCPPSAWKESALVHRTLLANVGLLIVGGMLPAAAGEPLPLHERIDQQLALRKDFGSLAAPPADDAEFLRRIYLDLTGSIPSATATRAFLADTAPDKRARLIDQLLASPEHFRHLATVIDVCLMERRPSKNVPQAQWHEYLRSSFAANKPWDQLVREILSADGADPQQRATAKFFLDRDAEPHLLTKDVTRLFLGRNFSCNQCHDSPVVDDYKQADYYGVFAFLNRTTTFTDKNKQVMLAEKAEGEATFESVFDPAKVTKTARPRLLAGPPVEEPKFEKGKEYQVAPAKDVRSVPTFSRRVQLAPLLTSADNRFFKRNAANRFWALMMGRGLVHPVDLDHTNNPPSHPELLDLLSEEFAANKFDVRAFLHEIALSQAYQRSSRPRDGHQVPVEAFAVRLLKPLTPDQLGWSLMQATGLTDAERKVLGDKANEAALYSKLSGNVASIVATFGSQPGQAEGDSFQATLDQALFLSNGGLVRGWLAARPGNLLDRLSKLQDPATIAEELHVSTLTRRPTMDEEKLVKDYLQSRGSERQLALEEMIWAMLTSTEFRFNH
jgi:uncharacterized protein DUF1549/uncharacterized protein DUF1553